VHTIFNGYIDKDQKTSFKRPSEQNCLSRGFVTCFLFAVSCAPKPIRIIQLCPPIHSLPGSHPCAQSRVLFKRPLCYSQFFWLIDSRIV